MMMYVGAQGNQFQDVCPLPIAGSPHTVKLDLRYNQLTDKAVACIAAFLAQTPGLAEVDLRDNKFSPGGCAQLHAAASAAPGLKQWHCAPEAAIASCKDAWLTARSHCTQCQGSPLLDPHQQCTLCQDLGLDPRGHQQCTAKLPHFPLKDHGSQLDLFMKSLGDQDAPSVASTIAAHPELRTISLFINQFHASCPLPPAGSPIAETLYLASNALTDAVAPCVTAFLRHSPKLIDVYLQDNQFSQAACARMKAAAPKSVNTWFCK
jgi:hypothetical protein